jgi:hypothetical protein
MPKLTEGQYVLGALTAFSIWVFAVLPLLFLYHPETTFANQPALSGDHKSKDISPTSIPFKLFTASGRDEISEYCALNGNADKEKQDWSHKYICDIRVTDTYIALFSALLVVVTIGLIYVGIRQAKLTKEALIADKRAFVFAKGVSGFWERDSSNGQFNWRFRPLWENSGETPTKNMTMHTTCVLRDTQLQLEFNFSHATTDIGTALLAPKTSNFGGIGPQAPGPAISPQDILDVQNGRKFLYLWGWARYNDVFPNTPQHVTRFAWAIVAIGNPLTYDPDIPPG